MRADLHMHSVHSDGRQSVDELIRRAKELGMGAVAITDHNTMEGCPDRADGIIVMRGVEITTSEGHLLAYHIDELVPRDRGVEEAIDLVHDQGGVAVAAHPYRWWSGLGEDNIRGRAFDAVEVINSRSMSNGNRRAAVLAKDMSAAEMGGSDAHTIEHVGRAYTIFPDDCQNADDLIKAIRQHSVSADGESRRLAESFAYGTKSIARWALRGFRRT